MKNTKVATPDEKNFHRILLESKGKVRPLLIAIVIVVLGLTLRKDWLWQVGVVIIISLFIDAYSRYKRIG